MLRLRILAFSICVGLLAITNSSLAQEPKAQDLQHQYEEKVSAARAECTKLWSNPAFDSLRKRMPLTEEKPTFAMLKNPERLKPRERPVADLAIKTLETCRKQWQPVYEILPPEIRERILTSQRLQDARIAELYNGKITVGEFNIATSKLLADLVASYSGISQSAKMATDEKTASESQKRNLASISESEKFAPGKRIALVIGNSNYINLPKLANPVNDAKAISDLLGNMGYTSRLLLDSSEQNTRREIRQFASDSERAEAALIYYAGHGAQVNGANYLLPIDADVPRTEVDIQFSALKVDDLVNSIHANTKIVFLDACRDNPAIYKNLAKGRGSSPVGLAPAASANFEPRAGGGIFIAYATDAGAVADDGRGTHSPFTEALLRNMRKPISIDDMFSLVTKEVRLITKNSQRPYKYASLENIFCLSPSCGGAPATPSDLNSTTAAPLEQAQQSEAEELSVARATKKVAALQNFLSKYPDAPDRKEVESLIESLKLSEFSEWTLYELGDQRFPYYVQISSIKELKGRVALRVKFLIDPNSDKTFFGRPYPDARYIEQVNVYDCQNPKSAMAEATVLGDADSILYHYKWADPQYLDLSIGAIISPGSVASSLRRFACSESVHSPLVTKGQLARTEFKSLASTLSGDGEIFYEQLPAQARDDQNHKLLKVIFRFYKDHAAPIVSTASLGEPLMYRTEVDRADWRCAEKKFAVVHSEFYSSSNELVYMTSTDETKSDAVHWIELKDGVVSPLSTLNEIVCNSQGASK
jgi:hypothetical protein